MEPVSVIINVFNEIDTIESEIRSIHSIIIQSVPGSELIVAEDGSRDGTSEVIKKLVQELGIIHSTSVERKGYTKAFRDAVELAKNPWIFFSDTGGKNDFHDFWKLYEERNNVDLVIGVRSQRTDQLYRRAMTWCYNKLLQMYFGITATDSDSGFRLYRTSFLKEIVRQNWINKELISSEIVVRMHYMGARMKEIPVVYRQRKGVSRGLPPKKIPRVIVGVVRNMSRLKKESQTLSLPK